MVAPRSRPGLGTEDKLSHITVGRSLTVTGLGWLIYVISDWLV